MFGVVVAMAFYVWSRMAQKQQRALRELAAQMGLRYVPLHMGAVEGAARSDQQQELAQSQGGSMVLQLLSRLPMTRSWRIHGQRGGVTVHIGPDAHGHGTPMTRLRADFAQPLGLGLELLSRSGLDGAALPALLSRPDVRRELLALFDAHEAARVDDRGVQIRLHGRVSDAALLVRMVDAAVRAAQAIQAAHTPS